MKNKILILIFVVTIVSFVVIFLLSWSISIFDIDADNYERKLHTNNESLWCVNIDDYIPTIDKECFSISMRGISALGQRYGVKILKTDDLTKAYGIRWTNDLGTYYSFEPAPSDLEYKILYEKNEDPNKTDKITEIRIDSKLKDENAPKIKQIIKELIEQNGFTLIRSSLILGSDIIIKETKDSFIIGVINLKYESRISLPHGLYIKSYSKKHLF